MFEKFANIFRIPDLRRRILFTLGLLAVYRLGGHIPTPGVNADRLQQFFEQNRGSFLGFVDLFSGGQLRRLTIFALGIMPYITASIILQLLTVVYEPLAKLQKEGELGRKKITQWTRYITVVLSAVQSFGIAYGLQKQGDFVIHPGAGFILMTMLTLTTGSAFIMWLGEQITERGVGNGMSLLIFAGIVVGLPRGIYDLIDKAKNATWGAMTFPLMVFLVAFMIAVVGFIVWVERSERRLPVQYAKRVVGPQGDGRAVDAPAAARKRRWRDAGDFCVIDLDAAADRRLRLAQQSLFRRSDPLAGLGRAALYPAVRGGNHIFFAYFYVSIIFNPSEVADNMRKYGGFIPGIRPGKRTADFINEVLTRITLVGALYLIIISFIPEWMIAGIHLNHLYGPVGRFFENLPTWMTNGLGVNFYFGGTSLLIVIGVAMDTVTQIEAQLIMRHYDGFTPRSGRIRGRRNWS